MAFFKSMCTDFIQAWDVLVFGLVFTIIVGFAYMALISIECVAAFMIYGIITLLLLFLLLCALFAHLQ